MTKKVFPLELTKSTEELKKLIAEHPDYPIVVLAGEWETAKTHLTAKLKTVPITVMESAGLLLSKTARLT